MISEIEYQCNNCGHEGYNTRAVPEVPELVRYYAVSGGNMMKHDNGLYVLYSQAAEIIRSMIPRVNNCGRYIAERNDGTLMYLNHENTWQGCDNFIAAKDARIAELSEALYEQRALDNESTLYHYNRSKGLEADNAELTARVKELELELEQAKKEINTLLVSYVREHFFENKTFQPLGDLVGQISQLDNAITITRDFKNRAEAAEANLSFVSSTMTDIANELGCNPYNEEILQTIFDMKSKLAEYEKQEPVAWRQYPAKDKETK